MLDHLGLDVGDYDRRKAVYEEGVEGNTRLVRDDVGEEAARLKALAGGTSAAGRRSNRRLAVLASPHACEYRFDPALGIRSAGCREERQTAGRRPRGEDVELESPNQLQALDVALAVA
jgi:hypothetical protein